MKMGETQGGRVGPAVVKAMPDQGLGQRSGPKRWERDKSKKRATILLHPQSILWIPLHGPSQTVNGFMDVLFVSCLWRHSLCLKVQI